MKPRSISAALAAYLLFSVLPAAGEPRTLLYFWAEGCHECSRAGLFLDELERAHLDLAVRRYEVTRNSANLAILRDTMDRHRTSISSLPAFFLDDLCWCGFDGETRAAIQDALENRTRPAAAARAAPDPTPAKPLVVAFFHEELCPSCEGYRRALDLAARVMLLQTGGRGVAAEAHSLLESGARTRLLQLHERCSAPCDDVWAPLLIVGDRCVAGYDEIEDALQELESGAERQ
jgi:hypothetical protein